MFVAEKLAALARAGINMYKGISAAASSAPPPYNLVPIGIATAQGIAQIAGIKKQKAPSARAEGGYTQKGNSYNIAERKPEIFIPNQNGSVVSGEKLERMMKGGGGDTAVNFNFYGGNRDEIEAWYTENRNKIMSDIVKLDCSGLVFPMPVAKTKSNNLEMKRGEILEVTGDFAEAGENIKRYVEKHGDKLLIFKIDGENYSLKIEKA